jgi:hypothetical protein
MNEAQVRDRLRKAIGEASYPAYLSSRIEGQLKPGATARRRRGVQGRAHAPWPAGFGRVGALVAALLVVLLMGSLVLGVRMWLVNSSPAAAGQGLTIKQYQAMVRADDMAFESTLTGACVNGNASGCQAEVPVVVASLRHWLDDLNRVEPPTRFSAVAVIMRRHLTLIIADDAAIIAAASATDENRFQVALDAWFKERSILTMEADAVGASSQGSVTTYTARIRSDTQLLVSQMSVSCEATQAQTCAAMLADLRVTVETFLGDLARVFAPDSLAAKDGRLQADLLSAYSELDAMDLALSAGDQVALQGGDDALRQALVQVQSDAADIVNSG